MTMPIKGNKNQPVQVVEVDETEVVEVEETEANNTNEATNGASDSNVPKRRGAPKGVSRGPAYPWTQEQYDVMKSAAQEQAKASGTGVVNISELHRTLVKLPEFSSVPMELKELTLRNFYNARRDQLKTWNLPEGVTQRTPEQVNAILPKVGGTRTKLQLA